MIILHFHLKPQFIYELFHINFTSNMERFQTEYYRGSTGNTGIENTTKNFWPFLGYLWLKILCSTMTQIRCQKNCYDKNIYNIFV